MADATLIQGARLLAKAKTGVNPGAAFSAGMDKEIARGDAAKAKAAKEQAKQNKESQKFIDDKFDKFDKAAKGIGVQEGLTTDDIVDVDNNVREMQTRYNEFVVAEERARANNDIDARSAARAGQVKVLGELGNYNTELKTMQQGRLSVEEQRDALSTGAAPNIQYNQSILASNSEVLENGSLGFKVKPLVTADIADDFIDKSINLFTKSSKSDKAYTATDTNTTKANLEVLLPSDDALLVPKIELLIGSGQLRALNAGFEGIEIDYTSEETIAASAEAARIKILDRVTGTIAGNTQIKQEESEAPTNWTDNLDKNDRKNLNAYKIKAPEINVNANVRWVLVDSKGNRIMADDDGVFNREEGVSYLKQEKTSGSWTGDFMVPVGQDGKDFIFSN